MRTGMTRLISVAAGLCVAATLLAAGSCPCDQPADHIITISQAASNAGCEVVPEVSEVVSGSTVKLVNKYTTTLTLKFEAGVFTQADQVDLTVGQCANLIVKPVTQELDTQFVVEGCPNQPGPKIVVKP